MRMRTILTAALMAAMAGGGFFAATTSAAAAPRPPSACPPGVPPPEYPPGRCRLVVEPTTVAPGGAVQVAGCGFKPGSRVNVALDPADTGRAVSLGRLTADGGGCINGSLTLRGNTKAGSYIVRATGKNPDGAAYELVSDTITVTAAATARPVVAIDADRAASTGPARGAPARLVVAFGLLVLGSLVVSGLRRRRPTT